MTNGDKMRQMSNEALADLFEGECKYCAFSGSDKCTTRNCWEGAKAYFDMEVE